ncbi:hypothetical protein T265_10882 [Opisthorchis viverrini]|uniref:Uncharacterized protein n=1 Tax=Opisthorchis viverrini TaxID=6198 RepID=A0A074Z0N4_OPIVI|nr:hypothetical protein T265_10882 [Opisthorchis viverrini]KER20601.1 hypothetical protein T265_10882 [Opisthorchis viverrini]
MSTPGTAKSRAFISQQLKQDGRQKETRVAGAGAVKFCNVNGFLDKHSNAGVRSWNVDDLIRASEKPSILRREKSDMSCPVTRSRRPESSLD